MGTAPAAYMGKPTAAVGLPGPVSAATNAADAGTAYGVPSDADRATGSPIYSAPVRSAFASATGPKRTASARLSGEPALPAGSGARTAIAPTALAPAHGPGPSFLRDGPSESCYDSPRPPVEGSKPSAGLGNHNVSIVYPCYLPAINSLYIVSTQSARGVTTLNRGRSPSPPSLLASTVTRTRATIMPRCRLRGSMRCRVRANSMATMDDKGLNYYNALPIYR